MYPTRAIGPPKPKHPRRRKYKANCARDASAGPGAGVAGIWVAAMVTSGSGYFKNGDARCRNSIVFLLGYVDAVGLRVNGQAVPLLLSRHISQLANVRRIIFLKYGDSAFVASDIDSL